MSLLPSKIREERFKTNVFGGYSKKQVAGFLQEIALRHQELITQLEHTNEKNTTLEAKISQAKDLEIGLLKALGEAQNHRKHIESIAAKEARTEVMKAKHKAATIVDDARRKAEQILRDAHDKYRQRIQHLSSDIDYLESHYQVVDNNANRLVTQMTAIVEDINKRINKLNSQRQVAGHEHKTLRIRQDASKVVEGAAGATKAVVGVDGLLALASETTNSLPVEGPDHLYAAK